MLYRVGEKLVDGESRKLLNLLRVVYRKCIVTPWLNRRCWRCQVAGSSKSNPVSCFTIVGNFALSPL